MQPRFVAAVFAERDRDVAPVLLMPAHNLSLQAQLFWEFCHEDVDVGSSLWGRRPTIQ
jgi:hypothetical protein